MNGRSLDLTIEQLEGRDLAILTDLERFRLLSTRHLQRLHFHHGHASTTAAARACTRALDRLRDHGLITPLDRRVGGARRGSASYVWQLGASGERLLRRHRGLPQRRRYVEPSGRFTRHTLAVADVAVELIETARAVAVADGNGNQGTSLTIEHLGTEPDNWTSYLGPAGETRWVKPDLHVITSTSENQVADSESGSTNAAFEDHAFLEIDLATEHMPRILAKCVIYAQYAATGAYQARHGLFPTVIWLSADPARKRALKAAIANSPRLAHELFQVASPAEYLIALADGTPLQT